MKVRSSVFLLMQAGSNGVRRKLDRLFVVAAWLAALLSLVRQTS
jgi:hypothetical protein